MIPTSLFPSTYIAPHRAFNNIYSTNLNDTRAVVVTLMSKMTKGTLTRLVPLATKGMAQLAQKEN